MADITLEMLFPSRCLVAYSPPALHGAPMEYGVVSSCNNTYVFVKFSDNLNIQNGNWDAVTSKACYPKDLIRVM